MNHFWKKIVVHVDMDAFFASVEQLLHPEWRGKPVIVGADPQGGKGRGVVSAASYEARKYGVHSAIPISQAFRLCPQGIYVKPHGNVYKEYSPKFFSLLNSYTPVIEIISIDEAFLDMSGNKHFYHDVVDIGKQIKTEIKRKISLSASVGIAPNKSLAKIASDFQKPDGLTIIYPDKIQEFLDPMPVTKLWGIGQKTFEHLQKMGIKTIYHLRQYPEDVLKKKFGKMGLHIYKMARGEDDRSVIGESDTKSVSNEITFDEDRDDFEYVRKTIFALSEKASGRLRRLKIRGSTIHLKIRFANFKTYNRSHTLENSTNLTEEIFQTADFLLSEFNPLRNSVRLVGIGVSHLVKENALQMNLWEHDMQKKMKAEKVMDQIQDKYGKGVIKHAEAMFNKKRNEQDRDQ